MPQFRHPDDKSSILASISLKKLSLLLSVTLLAISLGGCSKIGTTQPAALQVTSTPETSVFLDGKHVGKTPFFSDQLKNKQYQVKLTSGEATYIEKVTLTEGTLTVINRELNNNFLAQSGEVLRLKNGEKGLFIVSMPPEADISIDGGLIGKTPYKIDEIKDGEHKILISKEGYVDREFAVKTSQKYQLIADVTLSSQIAKGSISSPIPSPEPEMVQVQKTPQGFLRVRREASVSAAEIGRVKENDKLELIQETDGWIQIKFEDKQGWISSEYIKKIL